MSKNKPKEKKQAVNRGIPKFYGLRIYVISTLLFFMLVIPFLLFLGYRSIPEIAEKRDLFRSDSTELADSLLVAIDSLSALEEADIDSLVNHALILEESYAKSEAEARSLEEADSESDTLSSGGPRVQVSVNKEEESDSPFEEEGFVPTYFKLLFTLLLAAFLAGLIYNRRFKRYFKLKRRGREIPEKIQRYCKKYLLNTPVVNSLILIAPNVLVLLYSLFFVIMPGKFEEEFQRQMFVQLNYLSLLASLLEFLFVYYWQKHRVHIRYIEHIYTQEELRVQVFKRKGGKIRNRFLVASGMTTFLPLVIVMAYLILSLTSISDLELENFNKDQRDILIGPWSSMVNANQETVEAEKYQKLFYVNAIDSIVMMVGIGNGILVSLIYLLLFIRWTSRDISRPVKELLTSMRNTRGGGTEQYTIVRTNDEIGELAEGYNEMTQKIHAYVENISKMNQELEEKVKERTREVVEQKEEIEAQKEEIEAQLDLATLQRDTILNQKDQILDSIRYAERIQSAILSPLSQLSDQLADHFILFKPRDIVSGDFYWTTQQDDKILLAVADCTGHGVPGAFLSVLGISSMNEIVKQNGGLSASDILDKLRNFIIKSLHQTGSKGETQDGIEIALCILDLKKRTMEYAGANRPVYIVSGDSVEHIKPDRMPIGIYDHQVRPFTNHKLKLKKNDSVYLFSDGYVDQLGGPYRKTFRTRRFRRLLLDISEKSMSDQKQILYDTLKGWQGEVEQIDDILVMGIRV